MHFDLGPENERLREQVRAFIAEELTESMRRRVLETGTWHDPDFARRMGRRGWIVPTWPTQAGGAGLSWTGQFVIREELDRADAPVAGVYLTLFVASALRKFGSAAQQDELLPRIARGEIIISLGYTEANNGSDAAAARMTAARDGDEWLINGEKMFTTMAHVADYVFLVTRTHPERPKHKGLTMFLVPLNLPGISVDQVGTLGGERTNVTSYVDVRVPDSCRVGVEGQGWAVLLAALQSEQSVNWGPHLERTLVAAVEQARLTRTGEGNPLIDGEAFRVRAARASIDVEASRLLALRANWLAAADRYEAAVGPMLQLYSSNAYTGAASKLLDALSTGDHFPGYGSTGSPSEHVERSLRHSQVTRIYGGSSEILRSIIAERGLGLPRSRARD